VRPAAASPAQRPAHGNVQRVSAQTQAAGTATRPGPSAQQRPAGGAPAAFNRGGAASAPAAPQAPSYVVHPPSSLGGGRQQIRVTVRGTQQVAGSVTMRPTGAGKVYISDLTVDKTFRRRGLANQLMGAAMNAARSQGFSGARLEARPSDNEISPHALVSMYSRMGFRNVGKSSRGNPLMERRL
jgi:ribosomal protein S18 acetylase RimI-like enzyme